MSPLPRLRAWTLVLALAAGTAGAQELGNPLLGRRSGKPIAISRQDTARGPRWNVFCEGAELSEVLRALSHKTGLGLEGAELLPVGAAVTLDLRKRALEQALEYLLGSHGFHHELGPGTVRVLPPTVDPTDLLNSQIPRHCVRPILGAGASGVSPSRATEHDRAEGPGIGRRQPTCLTWQANAISPRSPRSSCTST
jgi:hypothetical protein